jgi:hypothetical protein
MHEVLKPILPGNLVCGNKLYFALFEIKFRDNIDFIEIFHASGPIALTTLEPFFQLL